MIHTTRYTLEKTPSGGNRWICHHENGERQTLPSGFSLSFPADVWPIGSEVIVSLPEETEINHSGSI